MQKYNSLRANKMRLNLPNFLIIGAAKAGTTSIYNYCSTHPEIFMSKVKEPRFLCWEGLKREECRNAPHLPPWRDVITNLDEYSALFSDAQNAKVRGEASPIYLGYDPAARRAYEIMPEAKILAILRNPIDRAFSSYSNRAKFGLEHKSFIGVIKEDMDGYRSNWRGERLAHQGFYFKNLQEWLKYFESQINVVLFDDLQADPIGFMRNIFSFLDVSVDHKICPEIHNIRAGKPTYQPLSVFEKFLGIEYGRQFLKLLPSKIRRSITPNRIDISALTKNERAYLFDIYCDDINKLSNLINRDLSH